MQGFHETRHGQSKQATRLARVVSRIVVAGSTASSPPPARSGSRQSIDGWFRRWAFEAGGWRDVCVPCVYEMSRIQTDVRLGSGGANVCMCGFCRVQASSSSSSRRRVFA
ncbi:hypothetical protein JDV02_001570 [Purpureocillium takamizusanense]|uniref:Uncharacterized protein n=1 Tax=Purpureocillium takamizusanense TaxID=2060973 RepID=A0A9Q8Q8K1_9HYPO|nr:uncharacterized protein JDV02_001570 [Purpureocillium takamizusanense]UNI14995.1 hypothetical protein JDV02_001570 [Purpureocillium takamizusanense]